MSDLVFVFVGGPLDGRVESLRLEGEPGYIIEARDHDGPGRYLRSKSYTVDDVEHFTYYWSPRGPICEHCLEAESS